MIRKKIKEEDWNWQGETINIYSFKQLKDYEINFGSSFIECFKFIKVYLKYKIYLQK